jgi:hypothetical protein
VVCGFPDGGTLQPMSIDTRLEELKQDLARLRDGGGSKD